MDVQLHSGLKGLFGPLWFSAPAPEGQGGGSGDTSGGTGTPTGSSDTSRGSGDDDKGPAGGENALKADLAAERARRHEAETARDEFQSQLQQFLKALTGGKPAEGSTDDPMAKIAELQRQVEDRENRTKAQLVRAEVKAIANQLGFHDPADAMSQIDVEGIKLSADGEVDSSAIEAKLKEVSQKKPYLLKVRDDASASDVGIGSRSDSRATITDDMPPVERIKAGHRAKAAQQTKR